MLYHDSHWPSVSIGFLLTEGCFFSENPDTYIYVIWLKDDEYSYNVKSLRIAQRQPEYILSLYRLVFTYHYNLLYIRTLWNWCSPEVFHDIRKRLSRHTGKPIWARGKGFSVWRHGLFRSVIRLQTDAWYEMERWKKHVCGEFSGYVVGGNVGEGIIRRASDAWIGETACQQRFCFAKK